MLCVSYDSAVILLKWCCVVCVLRYVLRMSYDSTWFYLFQIVCSLVSHYLVREMKSLRVVDRDKVANTSNIGGRKILKRIIQYWLDRCREGLATLLLSITFNDIFIQDLNSSREKNLSSECFNMLRNKDPRRFSIDSIRQILGQEIWES